MIPHDYDERVYAGWLGKCIGVRFGAPIENWTYEEIRDNLGELTGYLREDVGKIFKPDDDTSLPMILIRAFEDYGASPQISAQQFGETWLNYLGDEHGTLWWGGYGISTEHTAYRNLAAGLAAPLSGSIAMNGATIAEQIGGQIFSDIFGLIAPNEPALAADLAEKAASVSHDGNGLYGARFLAAMISAAFSERDPLALLRAGLAHIPADSEYARVINAMIDYHHQEPGDWRAGYGFLKANFGYDRYPGIVHIIPNAGVIALGMLYGDGDFSDKGQAVAIGPDGLIYSAGMTTSALTSSAAGGIDGYVLALSPEGEQVDLVQFGTSEWDEVTGIAISEAGQIITAGFTAGDYAGALSGDKDIMVQVFNADFMPLAADQLGSNLNDKGAAVSLAADGSVWVSGYSDGAIDTNIGDFDVVLLHYDADYARQSIWQIGTVERDGTDEWAEKNLFMVAYEDGVLLSGLTLGSFDDSTNNGGSDVFLLLPDIDLPPD